MKTKPVTGLTGVAQSGWKWNTAVALLAGGTYFLVSKTVAGAPNARINWAAGAAAIAVVAAGTLVRQYAVQSAQSDLDAAKGRAEALKEVLGASWTRPYYPKEVVDYVEKMCKNSTLGYSPIVKNKIAETLVIKDFPLGCVSGFSRQASLGKGGVKEAFSALYIRVGEEGEAERLDDCAWVETQPDKAENVKKAYELVLELSEHPNIARPWMVKWVNKRVIALEPRFPTTLSRLHLPWKEMVACMHKLAEGVAFLHDNLIVHRDLKPANIFISVGDDGRVKPVIGDFDYAVNLGSKTGARKGGGLWHSMVYGAGALLRDVPRFPGRCLGAGAHRLWANLAICWRTRA